MNGPLRLQGLACRKPRHWKRAGLDWLVLAGAVLCNACTWVEIHSGDGQVHVERHFGVVSLELAPDTRSRVVRLTSVGLVSTGFEATVGYADLTLVALGNDCRLVVWLYNEEQIDELRRLAGEISDACVMEQRQLGETKL